MLLLNMEGKKWSLDDFPTRQGLQKESEPLLETERQYLENTKFKSYGWGCPSHWCQMSEDALRVVKTTLGRCWRDGRRM